MIEVLVHRIMVKSESVPVVLDRLRSHDIHAQATAYDIHSGKTCIDWSGPKIDLDFLRPDILPPKEST
jgi:hypothetical protein